MNPTMGGGGAVVMATAAPIDDRIRKIDDGLGCDDDAFDIRAAATHQDKKYKEERQKKERRRKTDEKKKDKRKKMIGRKMKAPTRRMD